MVYDTFTYAYMPHIHRLQLIEILRSVTNWPLSDIPDILNKCFVRSTWQSSNFQVLMRFSKRAREPASRISIDTCCQSWLAWYEIASSLYFYERSFSLWKMWKFCRFYIFSLNWKYHSSFQVNTHLGTYKLQS